MTTDYYTMCDNINFFLNVIIQRKRGKKMKKKFVSLVLILVMVFSATACSTKESEKITEETEETKENDSIEVDENLLTVEITVPAEYMEDTTQEDLDDAVKENSFKSATLNEDGSATYVMTKGKHKEFMSKLSEEFNSTLSEMVGSTDYPNFTDIEANSDFTSFKITTKSTELDFNESFSVLAFYMYGGFYNSFNGTPVDNIHVDFVNADSGEIISSADSKDLAEESE